ncbi:hypothetical protein LEN_0282 [Lysobacter enzymogenes]|uniref:Uncharacterized protein n=1 Tax=Lysobacter enzymogenes TaxID=69 RepID=A0AAU9AHZ3_LYSEN|nr:hypothetical protein LEN_0282 [Lysobacter enzymogenes]
MGIARSDVESLRGAIVGDANGCASDVAVAAPGPAAAGAAAAPDDAVAGAGSIDAACACAGGGDGGSIRPQSIDADTIGMAHPRQLRSVRGHCAQQAAHRSQPDSPGSAQTRQRGGHSAQARCGQKPVGAGRAARAAVMRPVSKPQRVLAIGARQCIGSEKTSLRRCERLRDRSCPNQAQATLPIRANPPKSRPNPRHLAIAHDPPATPLPSPPTQPTAIAPPTRPQRGELAANIAQVALISISGSCQPNRPGDG